MNSIIEQWIVLMNGINKSRWHP